MPSGRRRCARVALILAAALAASTADGHEVLYVDEGRVYRGGVLDGRPHGEGLMIWPSGAVHTGTWVDGARHAGTFRTAEGVAYVGQFRDGERAGHGRFTWPDGRAYEGAWRAGMRHGQGVETLPGGLSRRCTWQWGEVVRETCAPGR